MHNHKHLNDQEGKYGMVFLAWGFLWTEMKLNLVLMQVNILFLRFIITLINLKGCTRYAGFSKCAGDRRFRRLLSHSRRLMIYQVCVFQQFLCLCELLSRFIDLYLLIDYFSIAINRTLTNPPFSKYI
jgi:hypothetical protein